MLNLINTFLFGKTKHGESITPKGVKRVTYPFNGYEKLSINEKYKIIGENTLEHKLILKK